MKGYSEDNKKTSNFVHIEIFMLNVNCLQKRENCISRSALNIFFQDINCIREGVRGCACVHVCVCLCVYLCK